MGNRASNSSTATKAFHGETVSLCTTQELNKETFAKYGNLTKNGNEGDFISFKVDPRDWNPADITPSKIFEFTKPSTPPPTKNSMAMTHLSSSRNQMLKRNSPFYSPEQSIPKIDWDRIVMTPFSFPRSRGTHSSQGGEGVTGSKVPKLNLELVSPGIGQVAKSSNSSVESRDNNANEKGDAISQRVPTTRMTPISLLAKGSSSTSNGTQEERGGITSNNRSKIPPAWLPDIRTSAARTNLRKKSPKSSILPFRIGKFGKRKSPPSLSKLKYTLKSSNSSKLNFKSKSLTHRKSVGKLQKHSSQHLESISNITTPASTAIRIRNPKNDPIYNDKNHITTSSSSSNQLQELLRKNIVKMPKGSVNNNRQRISPPDNDDEIVTESYDETYSYSYETDDRGSGKSASPPKKTEKDNKNNGKRKGDPSSSSGSEPTDAGRKGASGTGTTSASTSDKSSKSKSEGYSGSKSQSGYKKSPSYYATGGGESGETSSSRINNRRPKKKIPPPPVFIGSTGCCGAKKKNETPADRLKNVDIVEELIYNCPGDDDNGCEDSCCCCNLDYYACCNECGEIELVPQCTCCPKKKEKNPVRYCRRQHFNFDDGKKGDEDCCDGPPFCWEDRPTNPYDDIPVGKNPVIGKDNGVRRGGGCCGGDNSSTTTTSNRHHHQQGRSCVPEDLDGVMPAESGTYFFDAERRCFVPVVEIQEPPPPPSPEVVDEIIDEEPVLTNIEPIIQPVIQPMGGQCCCPNGGCCPMPFMGPMTCAGMGCCTNPCEGGKGSSSNKKNDKDSSTNSGSGSTYASSKSKGSDESSSNNNQQIDNLGMMGLCGMNMNGLANMGPYGTMAMPIMKYQPPCPCPPKAQECCPPPCCQQQPCCPNQCCQPTCQPICFPPCPYPMYCNPMCCNGKKKKKKDKKKKKKTKDSSSGGTNTTTETTSTSNQTSTNTGSTNDNDDDDE